MEALMNDQALQSAFDKDGFVVIREFLSIDQLSNVLIHQGNTIHRADANRSATRHRRSFGVVIQAESCVRHEPAFENYLQASKAQHQEFGLNVS